MSVSWRFTALALAGLAVLVPSVSARPPGFSGVSRLPVNAPIAIPGNYGTINPNFYVSPSPGAPYQNIRQTAYNVGVLGQAASTIPPYLLGYNPYPQVVNTGPNITAYNPYALSTAALGGYGASPYYGASLAASPYGGGASLSTAGYGGSPGVGGYPGYGSYSPYASPGGYLVGAASLTSATGGYYKDLMQARLLREQARQAALDTERRRIQDEAAYERMRPTALDMRDREMATNLAWARRDPPASDVWSGSALNDLLRSVNAANKPGPSIELEPEVVGHINLTDAASRGNVGLLKSLVPADGKLNWPLTFQSAPYEEARKRLSRNLKLAVAQIKDHDPLDPKTLKDLQADYATLSDTLASNVGDMPPSQYIEARRFLRQIGDALKALEDPKIEAYLNNAGMPRNERVKVGTLVKQMRDQGLRFAPAVPGDEAAYNALYQALRQYEAAVAVASSAR